MALFPLSLPARFEGCNSAGRERLTHSLRIVRTLASLVYGRIGGPYSACITSFHRERSLTMATEKTQDVRIDFPGEGSPHLRLSVAPVRLRISAGEATPWVEGTFLDPTGSMPLTVLTEGASARISSNRNITALRRKIPELDLKLGTGTPFALTIETGATDGTVCDLGGVPLTLFDTKYGAGKYTIDFSRANPQEMPVVQVGAGAAELTIRNLANANAANIAVDVGAIRLRVDFGGELKRDTQARINAGMADTSLAIPSSMAARVKITSTLGSQKIGDGFIVKEGAYWTPAAAEGKTPLLHVEATSALGMLKVSMTGGE
jgi:hypothetical protein